MHMPALLAATIVITLASACTSQSSSTEPDFYYRSGLSHLELGLRYHSMYAQDPSACVQWRIAQDRFMRSTYDTAESRYHELALLLEQHNCRS